MLLALCAGNSPVTGEFPAQRAVTRSFDVFFDLRLNKRLSKQSWGWWFETPSRSLWRHHNGIAILVGVVGSSPAALTVTGQLLKAELSDHLGRPCWINADLLLFQENIEVSSAKCRSFCQGLVLDRGLRVPYRDQGSIHSLLKGITIFLVALVLTTLKMKYICIMHKVIFQQIACFPRKEYDLIFQTFTSCLMPSCGENTFTRMQKSWRIKGTRRYRKESRGLSIFLSVHPPLRPWYVFVSRSAPVSVFLCLSLSRTRYHNHRLPIHHFHVLRLPPGCPQATIGSSLTSEQSWSRADNPWPGSEAGRGSTHNGPHRGADGQALCTDWCQNLKTDGAMVKLTGHKSTNRRKDAVHIGIVPDDATLRGPTLTCAHRTCPDTRTDVCTYVYGHTKTTSTNITY